MATPDIALFGRDLFGEIVKPKATGPVAERFTFPPFTVLDARAGEWQDRKRAWYSVGLKREIQLVEGYGGTGKSERVAAGSNAWNDLSTNPRVAESTRKIAAVGDGATIFDPVLCELAYRWWTPECGQVVDPFAGGSVRGVVAAMLGRRYWGGELRAEQVEENRNQAAEIGAEPTPRWETGDSVLTLPSAPVADFVFSCPPYGDLERYSDDPADLSAMEWPAFLAAYRSIVAASIATLRTDRFACFVVGDFRDARGLYRNFVSETISAFVDAGAPLYNEAILVGSVGSASMRVSRQFAAGRKLCKTHQNVLVFVKGDPMRAAKACGEIK